MKKFTHLILLMVFLIGCASSNVWFTQIDESYVREPKPKDAEIVFRRGRIERPHRVIGVIEVELDKTARKVELDALMVKKAREIGADGVMLVEYDVDRDVYVETHHAVVGQEHIGETDQVRHHRTETRKQKTSGPLTVVAGI